jgi:hypothetical protein
MLTRLVGGLAKMRKDGKMKKVYENPAKLKTLFFHKPLCGQKVWKKRAERLRYLYFKDLNLRLNLQHFVSYRFFSEGSFT